MGEEAVSRTLSFYDVSAKRSVLSNPHSFRISYLHIKMKKDLKKPVLSFSLPRPTHAREVYL